MTLRAFKCRYCGYRFRADPEEQHRRAATSLFRHVLSYQPALKEAKRTVDLTCPNCEQDFEVEVEG